ncbi:hypothetical protein OGAPHI_005842 [Ogataea philodendri]|uniref:Uncharacterized protein n=1 Tax=Ogataea philodendri TaxID=1378263 RepID=A0A9P8NZZ0_9ASCO|nr:uncharacterized protein OGAPHI_005842 [Ogataea philodendri]KAH3662590.1 hypothetical protein OGAPHI_005842 [Ogataea philodendri]
MDQLVGHTGRGVQLLNHRVDHIGVQVRVGQLQLLVGPQVVLPWNRRANTTQTARTLPFGNSLQTDLAPDVVNSLDQNVGDVL